MKNNVNAHYSQGTFKFRDILKFVRALRSPLFSHTRCHPVSPHCLNVVHLDRFSPSGKCTVASLPREYAEEVLERLNKAGTQLSPTEGLRSY